MTATDTVKHKPATQLPWKPWTKRVHHEIYAANDQIVAEVRQCSGPNGSTHEDAAYIAHACNAYPQLVAALRKLIDCRVNDARGTFTGEFINARLSATTLLRTIGESA